jgi:hypothetical protein
MGGSVASQNRAIAVCSAVRRVLPFSPSSFTSWKSRAQTSLSSRGGAPGRT